VTLRQTIKILEKQPMYKVL